MDADSPTDVRLTDTQLGILAALCRPIASGNTFATPATNQEIADEVFLSVDAVKGHLRTLYRKFGIEDLPHNQKRARLVELAIAGGYIRQERADRADDRARTGAPHPPHPPRQPGPAPVAAAGASPSAILIVVIAGLAVATSGLVGSSSPAPAVPSPAAYRTEVAEYCELALAGAPTTGGGDRAETAGGYLEVIETMRGRLESLTPPAEHQPGARTVRHRADQRRQLHQRRRRASARPRLPGGSQGRRRADLRRRAGAGGGCRLRTRSRMSRDRRPRRPLRRERRGALSGAGEAPRERLLRPGLHPASVRRRALPRSRAARCRWGRRTLRRSRCRS